MDYFFSHLIHEFNLPLTNPVLIFSLILLIILLSPILLKKLNIPGIIGLIISGVIIGPEGLNILAKNSAIDLFSTIGLLYIMFIAGLELDINEFKVNKNKSLLFGFFTFLLPLSIGFPVCYYFLEYDLNASILTASMFATHTLVAYPIVSKLGVAKNQAVAITVGGTILTDTAVLIILAIVMSNSKGSLNTEFLLGLLVSLTVFSAIMFFVVPKIAKWFFRKLESEKHSHYIFVLSIVFFAAFLAEVAGVEPIIGAFVSGLALNKLIPHSSALMNRIEFIGNALFIPFFLISVGMLVDVSVILSGPVALIVAGTLSVVAIIGKWLAAFITQLAFRYSKAQRQLIFGLSSAHAAATLAVILVGYKAGILDENILNGTIILILVTCIVASFATEKAAKKIVVAMEDDSEIQAYPKPGTEHILISVAEFHTIEKLMELSIFIKDKKSLNPLSILSVVSNNDEAESNILKTRNKLEKFVKEGSASENNVNVITTIDYNIASGITRISRETLADIVVMGWPENPDLIDKFIGTKIDSIIQNIVKTIMFCQLDKPLVSHGKLKIAVPPLAEHEQGFTLWLIKMVKLAQELSVAIEFYCSEPTKRAIEKNIKLLKLNASFTVHIFTDWQNFFSLAANINEDDLFVLISARKGTTSYIEILDRLPAKLDKKFPNNNKLIIYPQQLSQDYGSSNNYEEISTEPLQLGIETVQRIKKGIGNIFKK